jgi:hypothetical protein
MIRRDCVLHWVIRRVAFVLAMAATTPKGAVTVCIVGKQTVVTSRDPAKVEHLASNISLNQLEKEVKLGPGQYWLINDNKGIVSPTI